MTIKKDSKRRWANKRKQRNLMHGKEAGADK